MLMGDVAWLGFGKILIASSTVCAWRNAMTAQELSPHHNMSNSTVDIVSVGGVAVG